MGMVSQFLEPVSSFPILFSGKHYLSYTYIGCLKLLLMMFIC